MTTALLQHFGSQMQANMRPREGTESQLQVDQAHRDPGGAWSVRRGVVLDRMVPLPKVGDLLWWTWTFLKEDIVQDPKM